MSEEDWRDVCSHHIWYGLALDNVKTEAKYFLVYYTIMQVQEFGKVYWGILEPKLFNRWATVNPENGLPSVLSRWWQAAYWKPDTEAVMDFKTQKLNLLINHAPCIQRPINMCTTTMYANLKMLLSENMSSVSPIEILHTIYWRR